MAEKIGMPKLGWIMEEGTLVEWLKQDGDEVRAGEVVFTVESDKALNEIESFESGILRIPPDSPAPGSTVPVGTLLAYLLQPGEPAPFEDLDAAKDKPAPTAPLPATALNRTEEPVVTAEPARGGEPAITPRARRVATQLGLDWRQVEGSGSRGRVTESDIRAMQAASTAADQIKTTGARPEEEARPLSQVRQRIAQRMAKSAHTTAAVTLTTEADATELVALRDRLKESLEPGAIAPTYNDLMVKLAGEALAAHPSLNATWQDNGIVFHEHIHVAFAVDTEDGLLAPVVRDVTDKSLRQIAAESAALIEKAQARKLVPDDLSGGSFTISNLGMYGIDAFTPIINLPECAILGVGRIISKPAVYHDQVVPRKMMALSLTFDHRVVDGGPASRFLNQVRQYVEQPYL